MACPAPDARSPAGSGPDPSGSAARPDEWARRAELRDRTPVLLRSIRPSDRDRLEAGLRGLSPATRHLRFHRPVEHLGAAHLRYLTDVDHVDHEAIVALDLEHPDRPGVGVARYQRDDRDPTVAELAITVDDRYQGHGAGTLLIAALVERARAAGIERFRSEVMDGNRRMLRLFDRLGATRRRDVGGWLVEWPLPAAHPSLIERILQAAAAMPGGVDRVGRRAVRRRPAARNRSGDGPDTRTSEIAALHDELDAWLQYRENR